MKMIGTVLMTLTRIGVFLIASPLMLIQLIMGLGVATLGATMANMLVQLWLTNLLGEPPRVYRRAKLSENCPLWNRHQRREPRSRIHLSSASVRCDWRRNTAMSIKAKLRR